MDYTGVYVDEELTRTDRLMAVWGQILTQEAPLCVPSAVSQCGGDVTTERRVQSEESVLGRRVVVVMMGGKKGRELLACGLVHHHGGAISCNIYQLTQRTPG